MLWSVALVGFCILLIRAFNAIWLQPRRIRAIFLKQDIGGPVPCLLNGNTKEMQKIQEMVMKSTQNFHVELDGFHSAWTRSVFPHFQRWAKQYGPMYMFSTANLQHLYVGKPEIIKALNLHKTLDLGRPTYLIKANKPMLGNGISRANGHQWAYQRKLIAPEFFIHKVKHMSGLMEECTMAIVRNWQSQVESMGGVADITVDKDLKSLSADIISKACFGTSYSQGKQIFAKMDALQGILSKPRVLFGLANFRFLPTKSNRETWSLQREIDKLIIEVVNARRDERQTSTKFSKDFLETLLESASNSKHFKHAYAADRFLVDICKNIYLGGHETTALSVSWTLMLLSLHPEWQERVRAEIIEKCGDSLHDCWLDLDKLHQFKTLNMVIQESLRLYGPAVIVSREAFDDMKLANLTVPKGTNIWLFIPALHRDPKNWGPDANEFKPDRFASGTSEACKYPQSYIPFGLGSRYCLGQPFATLELKIVLILILSNFTFSISPEYRHSPVYRMSLSPEHGIQLLVRNVQKKDNAN